MSTADAAFWDEVAALVAHAEIPHAAAIDALKLVQSRLGYVPDGAIPQLAAALRMSPAALDEVATFYNLIFRRPVGEKIILLCDSVACWMLGRDALQRHITARLNITPGETTPDGKFTLLPIVCLGACHKAPALMLGDTLHGDMTPAKLDALLDTVVA
jgi:NADH-quinone oxidoreductase subunit E